MDWIYKIVIGIIVLMIIFQLLSVTLRFFGRRSSKRLSKRYQVLVSTINNAVYNGDCSILYSYNDGFFLYQDRENQILRFEFISDQLTITWKSHMFHKELRKFQIEDISKIDDHKLGIKGHEIVSEMELLLKNKTQLLPPKKS